MATENGTTEAAADRTGEGSAGAGEGAEAEAQEHVCPVAFCPIGMALSSMERSGPDALEHLLAAGREVLLAAKAMVDARASDVGAAPDLEKIEVH